MHPSEREPETTASSGNDGHELTKGPFWRDIEGLRTLASDKILTSSPA